MPKTKCIYKKLLKHFIYKLLYIYISLWTSPSPRENYKSIFNSTLQMQSNIRNLWAMSNSLQPHGLQHARPLCPSPSHRVCPSSCPLNRQCHPPILILFSFCSQSFPASGTCPVSQLFASDDQNTGVSTSASVLSMSIQGWFPLGLTALITLLSKGLSEVFSSTIVRRHQLFCTLPSLWSNSHNHMWPLGRLDCMDLCWQSSVSAFQDTV